MNRRNFLQLLGAATLCSALGVTPLTDDEMRRQRIERAAAAHNKELRQVEVEFQRALDDLARRHNEWMARNGVMPVIGPPIALTGLWPNATPQEIAQAVGVIVRGA